MRTSRILITSAAIAGVALALPAHADPKASPTHVVAPYTETSTSFTNQCLSGTTCTPVAESTLGTGRVTAAMDMRRDKNDAPGTELGGASGYQLLAVRAPKGATKLTATFTWYVTSATASAAAEHGAAFAFASLSASGSCGSCTVTRSHASVAMASGVPGPVSSQTVRGVQQVLTVSVDNLPRTGNVTVYSLASASTEMTDSRVCAGDPVGPTCNPLPPVDATHSGTAHADIDAALTSIELSYS